MTIKKAVNLTEEDLLRIEKIDKDNVSKMKMEGI